MEQHIDDPSRVKTPAHHAYPAVMSMLLIAGGIALCRSVPCIPWLWLVIGALMIALGIYFRGFLADIAISAALVSIGLSAAQIERFEFPSDHVWNYSTEDQRLTQIELRIDDSPRIVTPSAKELRSLPPKQTAGASVLRISTRSGWRVASGQILLTIEQPNPRLAAGQIVRATGLLARPNPPTNPGEFDFFAWCRDRRILATFRVEHADGVEILADPGGGALNWLREKSRHLLAMGFAADRGFDHAFLGALILGDSDPQLRDLDEEFVDAGVIYQLSISGLHVAIIGAMALLICRLLRRSPRFSLMASLGVVAVYSMIAFPSWPGWRAVIMCGAVAAGVLSRRKPRVLQMFALAVAAVLLIHPADLTAAGFQISFAAVLGLILLCAPLERAFWSWRLGPDAPVLPRPHPVLRRFASMVAASMIAWLCTMPLVAYHFQRFNSYSVPISLLMLPLTILALVGGVMKIILSLCWPSASHLWATMAGAPMVWMHHGIDRVDKIPGVMIGTVPPSLWLIAAFYLLLTAVLIPANRRWMRWLTRLGPVLAVAALTLWPAACRPQSAQAAALTPSPPRHQIQITLLDIGAGQCGVIQEDSGHAILVDAGSSTVSDVADRVLVPYLKLRNCFTIDDILLSHGDFDHISAASEIFSAYNHPPVVISPHFERHAVGNVPATALLDTIRAAGYSPDIIHRGDHLILGDGAAIDVLWPPVDCAMNSNNCGLVVKLNYGGKTVLFPADIQDPPELELLKHPEELKSDVLVAPHHGSAELTTPAFIAAVHPLMILASNGHPESKKQRTFDTETRDYPVYRTSQHGAICLTIDSKGKMSVQTYDSQAK